MNIETNLNVGLKKTILSENLQSLTNRFSFYSFINLNINNKYCKSFDFLF